MITLLDSFTPNAANIVSAGRKKAIDHSWAENDYWNLLWNNWHTEMENDKTVDSPLSGYPRGTSKWSLMEVVCSIKVHQKLS